MEIRYPKFDLKIRTENEVQYIWDGIRMRWLQLTPEEWVRQNFIQYLILVKEYPASLLAIEKGIEINGLKKRCDIVIFKNKLPWLIVECKRPDVKLSQDTFMQIIRYNMVLQVPYLIITNGPHSLGWKIGENNIQSIDQMPEW